MASADAVNGHRSPEPLKYDLTMLKAWRLSDWGAEVRVPGNAQRLIALLALTGPHNRAFLSGTLWPERPESQAQGNLRSTLSRLLAIGADLIQVSRDSLALGSNVSVDVHEFMQCAESVIHADPPQAPSNGSLGRLVRAGDLLTGWYDDWVLTWRERLRQLRLHALETACDRLTAAGRYGEALDVALVCVDIEPLRETAHRAVIQVHLSEGNHTEAIRQLRQYRRLLRAELDLEPSAEMVRLVRHWELDR